MASTGDSGLSEDPARRNGRLQVLKTSFKNNPLHSPLPTTSNHTNPTATINMTSTVTKPTLTYFNLFARGEVPRLLLEDAGVDYDFVPVTNWPETKAQLTAAGKLAFGQVPLYEEPGLTLVQSNAIAHYLARKHGYNGTNPTVRVLCACGCAACAVKLTEKMMGTGGGTDRPGQRGARGHLQRHRQGHLWHPGRPAGRGQGEAGQGDPAGPADQL
jgi:hypothetical protein